MLAIAASASPDFSDSLLGVARARSRKISSILTAVMDSSPGLYRCASPNLAHFLRASMAFVTFFVAVCTRVFFVVLICSCVKGRKRRQSDDRKRGVENGREREMYTRLRKTETARARDPDPAAERFRLGLEATTLAVGTHLAPVFLLAVLDDRLDAVRVGSGDLRRGRGFRTGRGSAGGDRGGGESGQIFFAATVEEQAHTRAGSRSRTCGGGRAISKSPSSSSSTESPQRILPTIFAVAASQAAARLRE